MLDMLSGALASARAATDMSKSLLALRDEEKIRAAVSDLRLQLVDLMDHVVQAKEEQLQLLAKVDALERELSANNKKREKLQRYQLHQFETGYVAYKLREECKGEEPEHYLCSNCLEKSDVLITLHGKNQGLHCPACNTTIRATPAPPIKVHRRRSSYS